MIAATLLQVERGDVPASLAAEALTLCTDCGACQDHCHLHTPLPEAMRKARAQVLDAPVLAPLEPIVGKGTLVAIESDERAWGGALAERLGVAVRTWRTVDHLGNAGLHRPGVEARLARIAAAVGPLEVVVVSGGVAEVLEAAGVPFTWLRDRIPTLPQGAGSCRTAGGKPFACCGAAGPLRAHHPADAERLGALWLSRMGEWVVADSRCRGHLNGCGGTVRDPVDALLSGSFVR